ncbi:MAG: D-2-hydroxyacid dehydrogenase [Betaproteobacteria bacterium]
MAARPVRLHVENARGKADIYQVTPERWTAASGRHRPLARRLRVSFGWDGDTLETQLGTAELVIGVPARRENLAARAPALRWLHATSAGIDGFLPLDWLPRGVSFTNNRGAHGNKAQEYMRMAYTMLHTRMPRIIANQHERRWQQVFSPALAGRTALVVGLGDLGEAAARAARQLQLRVIGVRRTVRKSRHADAVHPYSRLDILLPQADFVVLAVPLTPETRNLLNRARLALLKPSACLINISRAAVVDYAALSERLRAGELAGAILDVVEPEPLPADSPLWTVPNLLITPHVSCDDAEHYVDISLDLWFENFGRYLARKPLLRRVDPRLGY